jgi:hypothetical protein
MLEVTINGVNRESEILFDTFRITDYVNQQVDTCTFECRNFKPLLNQEIGVYYDEQKIYGGVVVRVDTQMRLGTQIYTVSCKDFTQYLNRRLVSERYINKTVTEIITDLLSEYAPDFTMDNVEGDSVISQITFNRIKVGECIEALAEALNYSWYVDYDKDIHFFAESEELAPFNLTTNGGNHAWESLQITEDFSQIKNQITVIGGEYEAEERTELYVADGEQKQFPLAFKYSTITGVKIVGDIDLTVGIDGEDDEANFQVFWNVQQQSIRFKDSNKPDADDVVEIKGIPLFQVIVRVPDVSSIAQYGLYEFKIKDKNLASRADAIRRGVVELEVYASSIEEGSFNTDRFGLRSGQTININIGDVNEDFIIQSVTMSMKTPFLGKWSVRVATVRTLTIIRFLQKFLRIEDDVVEGEVLLELQQYADTSADEDSVEAITTREPPYLWADATDPDDEGKWNFFTWQ